MNQIKILLEFFKTLDQNQYKGVANIVDRIQYYAENDKVLTEDPNHILCIDHSKHTSFDKISADQLNLVPTYYFVKPPLMPKINSSKKVSSELTPEEANIRKYIKIILMDSEYMKQFRCLVNDKNSFTTLINLLRQQIMKHNIFVDTSASEIKYQFLIHSIQLHFTVY